MKKINIFLTLIILILLSCNQKKLDTKTDSFVECNNINDTIQLKHNKNFIDKYSVATINNLKGFDKLALKVNYTADSLQRYNFEIEGNRFDITIDSCVYQKNRYISTFFINKKIIKKTILFVNDSIHYGFDNLGIDYKNSTFYFNKTSNLLLIKSDAERLVGKAANWQFNQVININKPTLYKYYAYRR